MSSAGGHLPSLLGTQASGLMARVRNPGSYLPKSNQTDLFGTLKRALRLR
jgi:hypothetical protein